MFGVRLTILWAACGALFLPSVAEATEKPSSLLPHPVRKQVVLKQQAQSIAWDDTAVDLRGRLDQDFAFICPNSGRVTTVWGSDIYTDDSSICSAAVHAGLINARDGGVVTIRIRPGEDSYAALNRNGVRTNSYGGWHGSFAFLNADGEMIAPISPIPVASWADTATSFRGRLDQDFVFDCPSGGQVGTVWGTNIYTDDSSVCSAAVHAGLITARDGGTVTIRILPGEDAYVATDRNGVNTNSYGPWYGSFRFLR